MASVQKVEQKDDLQDSWVELHYQNNGVSPLEQGEPAPQSVYNESLENLLIEAQKESRSPSRANSKESSARQSPKSPHSPNNEMVGTELGSKDDRDPGTDWIWDWSSGPERQQPSDLGEKFKHPIRHHKLSVRNTRVMKNGVFCLENLQTLLLSHACSFFFGAAVMFMYMKRYCNWVAVASPTLD